MIYSLHMLWYQQILAEISFYLPISMTPVRVIQYYIRLSLLPVQQELGGVVEAIPRAVGNTRAAASMHCFGSGRTRIASYGPDTVSVHSSYQEDTPTEYKYFNPLTLNDVYLDPLYL